MTVLAFFMPPLNASARHSPDNHTTTFVTKGTLTFVNFDARKLDDFSAALLLFRVIISYYTPLHY